MTEPEALLFLPAALVNEAKKVMEVNEAPLVAVLRSPLVLKFLDEQDGSFC